MRKLSEADRERRRRHGATLNLRHGHARGGTSLTYRSWQAMLHRCYRVGCNGYERYGGRGIRVCGRWRKSFENFLADMGERPSRSHSIDRKDPSGDYAPENCRWATRSEQNRHRSNNVIVRAFGRMATLAEFVEESCLPYDTARARLLRGWTPEWALSVDPDAYRRKANRR